MKNKYVYFFIGAVAIISCVISISYFFYLKDWKNGLLTLSTVFSLVGLLIFWLFDYRILSLMSFVIALFISVFYIKIRYRPFVFNGLLFIVYLYNYVITIIKQKKNGK
jgi:hypothetical protein